MIKEHYRPNFTTNMMTFHSVLSTFLSSVAIFHRVFISQLMLELVVTAHTFCIALDFLQLSFCYKIEVITTEVLWLSSWTRGLLACIDLRHKKLICSTFHSFPFLFRLPWTCLFMSNSAGVSRKSEDAYPTGDLVHASSF